MKKYILAFAAFFFSIIPGECQWLNQGSAYVPITLESKEKYDHRTSGEDNRNGYREYVKLEFHSCANDYRCGTSYEQNCYDLYFDMNGRVYWDRRKFNGGKYNDELTGSYYLVKYATNKYDIYIRWDTGREDHWYLDASLNKPRLSFR